MASDDIWQAFVPKVRRGDHSSNLSQMSTASSFTKGGRLSLSCRVPTQSSSQAPRATTAPAVSFPGTPTSNRSSLKSTPASSTRKKAVPKSKSPADGLMQKKINFYFNNTPIKPDTAKKKIITVIDILSESSDDEEASKIIREDYNWQTQHKPVNSSSVSRVLFPSTSLHNSCLEIDQENPDCDPNPSIRNKENHNTSLQNISKSKSVEVNESSTNDAFQLPISFRYKVATKSNVKNGKLNHTTRICDKTSDEVMQTNEVKTMTNKVHENIEKERKSVQVNGAECGQNSLASKDQPSNRLPVSNLDINSESIALAVEKPQEWMTPPHEQEEMPTQNAATQWKTLMQKMQSGENTLKKKNSITSSSSSLSSTSTVTSRETWTRGRGWGRGGDREEGKSRTCPFYKLIQGTTFAVDAFSYGSIPGITHYFLSHYHYDHYMGLNKNFSHPIYCSSVTAKLVAMKIKVNQSLLNRLDPGQTVIVSNTKVTALDANHCPGSVMLLFELPNGKTHLHVGDFRAHPCMESYHPLWNVDIDRLYLDTTYCNPTYTFPSQQEIIGNITSIVDEAMNKEPKTLIVCGTYTIGKERVFAAVAEKLKTKIWAPADKLTVLQCVREGLQDLSTYNNVEIEGGAGRELGLTQALNLLTKKKEEAQVHVLPMAKLKRECLEDHLYSIKGINFTNVVAFRPTGWAHGRSKESNLVCNSPVVKIYEVAYSEHSSFLEMARFVKFIRPNQVIKTVNVGSPHQRKAMEKHIDSWLAEVRLKILIPNKQNDSPKTSRVTEEQKRAGIFQTKSGNKSFAVRANESCNSLIPETFTGGHSESVHYSIGTIVLSSQTLLSENQGRRAESHSSVPAVALKRTHSLNSGEPRKKRQTLNAAK